MKTILLIEDDVWLAELYRDVLVAADFKVVHVSDAQAGIAALDEQPVDLIVLDLLLPGHNGIGLLHELRSYPDLMHIPVVVHSNIDPTRSGLQAKDWRAYGVVAYLPKMSTRPQALVRELQRIVTGSYEAV